MFNAEDLHKQGNYQAIATVMMYNMPTSPFTMKLLPPMGEANPELLASMKAFLATKYGRTRAEVEAEIQERWRTTGQAEVMAEVAKTGEGSGPEEFLQAWKKKAETVRGAEPVPSSEPVSLSSAKLRPASDPAQPGNAPQTAPDSAPKTASAAQDEMVFRVRK